MKILVAVKRVVDHTVRPRVKPDGSGVALDSLKMAMNPFDEIAVEEAVRLKEAGIASEIVLVSVGPEKVKDTLRAGLALGADRAIHIQTDGRTETLAVAKLLREVQTEEQASLLLLGKQAIDDDCNQTGQMLAALLDLPQATNASSIEVADGNVRVVREIDGGTETLEMALPAIVTVDLRLNEPRYASLPNIMKAKSKPMVTRPVAAFGVNIEPRLDVLRFTEPEARVVGARVANIDELVVKIKAMGVF